MMDYTALKAELAKAAYVGMADAQIVAALAAQTTTVPQPVRVADVHGVLLLAPTGDWLRIEARSVQSYSAGYPTTPTATDQAINAAKLAVELAASKVDAITTENWSAFLAFLGTVVTAGDVASATQAAIEALATTTVPTWPGVSVSELAAARKWG